MISSLYRWARASSAPLFDRSPSARRAAGQVVAHLLAPLFRNGYALLFSGAASSGLGLLYWLLAARLYPPLVVGLGSTLLSAMILLAGIAQLSLNNVLIRFVPVAGPQLRRLVGWAYLASAVAAVGVSVIFIAGVRWWSPALSFLQSSPAWAFAFGLGVTAWCIFTLQDSVLTGLRQTPWVLIENVGFAAAKVGLVVALAGVARESSLFVSWLGPMLLAIVPINLLLWGRLLRRLSPASPAPAAPPFTRRQIVTFAGGNYLGTLLYLAQSSLLPLLVAGRAGPEAAAYFFLPWTIATGLQLIASTLGTSLTVEAALNQPALHSNGRRVLAQALRLLVPLVIALVLAAPWLLAVFGPGYAAQGVALLRWLTLAALPNVVIALALSQARVLNQPGRVALIQGAACLPALALSYALLPTYGIVAVGWAWLANQTGVALVLLLTVMRPAGLFGKAR